MMAYGFNVPRNRLDENPLQLQAARHAHPLDEVAERDAGAANPGGCHSTYDESVTVRVLDRSVSGAPTCT